MIEKYRLNPSDCLFYAFDHQLKKQGYAGSFMGLTVHLEGELDPAKAVEAIQRAMIAHPSMASKPCLSRLRAWPHWRYEPGPVKPLYRHYDLSDQADFEAVAERMGQEHASSASYIPGQALMSFEHYQGPNRRHRLSFVAAHALMDVEGAQHFLAEADRLWRDPTSPLPNHLMRDEEQIDPLDGIGLYRRLKLVQQGVHTQLPSAPADKTSLLNSLPDRPVDSRRLRRLHRIWPGDRIKCLRENALKFVQPGPMLYARYIAVCVVRAVHRVYAEYGRELPFHGMMLPIRCPGLERRPVRGNYLASPSLYISPARVTDKRAVAEDIDRQCREYLDRKLHLASWALLWLSAQLRAWQYRLIISSYVGKQPYGTGYSFFGQIDPPLREFVGAKVTNFWGTGVVSIPPGWNPAFSRFNNQINLGLAWPEAGFPEEVVRRYADLIEEEVFAG